MLEYSEILRYLAKNPPQIDAERQLHASLLELLAKCLRMNEQVIEIERRYPQGQYTQGRFASPQYSQSQYNQAQYAQERQVPQERRLPHYQQQRRLPVS